MGSGTFDAGAYRRYASTTTGKSTDEIYSSRAIDKDLNPKGVKLRDSRDSADSPNSTPIIIALDVTGSMGIIADTLARDGLGVLMKEILDSKPVSNPHIMFMAVGDVHCDQAPLQVSQFEADNRIVEQLTKIWLEHGGGGNDSESYNLPWYFAANHTEHDSIVKRGKRGYLFTLGDESTPERLTPDFINQVLGTKPERVGDNAELLRDAQRKYDVFHIIIEQGDYAKGNLDQVQKAWRGLLGQHVISLSDYKKVPETIVGTIEVIEGRDRAKVEVKYGSAVGAAVKHLTPGRVAPKGKLLPA